MSRFFWSMTWVLVFASVASAQSSSLYLAEPAPPNIKDGKLVNTQLQAVSYVATILPKPRQFSVHDLVTIIVRESSTTSSESTLETEKGSEYSGEISEFPNLNLRDLLRLKVRPNNLSDDAPKLGVKFESEFEGEGEYERRDEVILRVTARVVDVKPNGTISLEARKFIRNDDETQTVKMTGYCRAEDVAPDNTVLSTQMYDLRLEKTHEGELRKTSKKGVLTKVFDAIFNF